MTTKELLELNINDLQQAKFNAVKKEAISTLEIIISLLKENKFKDIDERLAFSPAGDGYGSDNYYINFSTIGENFDINDVLTVLKSLK